MRSARIIYGLFALLALMTVLWVPWSAPNIWIPKGLPPGEVFLGYGWFWDGPNPEKPFDWVEATRNAWGVTEINQSDLANFRATIEIDDFSSRDARDLAAKRILTELYPADTAVRREEVSQELIALAERYQLEEVLVGVCDRDQLLSWLRVRRNFEKTFPDKRALSHKEQLALLQKFDTEWNLYRQRSILRPFARVSYQFIVLELIGIAMFAGGTLAITPLVCKFFHFDRALQKRPRLDA